MILGPSRRPGTWSRLRRLFLLCFLAFSFIDVYRVQWRLRSARPPIDSAVLNRTKIFIASTHWNNEAILRSHWNGAVAALAQALGPENVYVSIYESGSWDDSKGALRALDETLSNLGVRRTIILDPETHADAIAGPPEHEGWIDTSRGKKERRRIPYLAALRNLTLQPLKKLQQEGEVFDKVLFLNDVVFSVRKPSGLSVLETSLTIEIDRGYCRALDDQQRTLRRRLLVRLLETPKIL